MKKLTMVLGVLALGGCAGSHIKKVAVCDGKHRRPANLYGTILPTLPVPLPPSQAGTRSLVAPGPAPGPGALPAPPPAPPSTPLPGAEPSAPTAPPPSSPIPLPAAPDPTGSARPATPPQTSQRATAPSFSSC